MADPNGGGIRTPQMDQWVIDLFPEARSHFDMDDTGRPPVATGYPTLPVVEQNRADTPTKRRDPPPSDDEVERVLKQPDLKKKLDQLTKWGIPTFPDDYEIPTPLTKLFKDLHSGMAQAKQYLDYIHKAADYLHKYGKALDGIVKVANQLDAIAKKLGGGLASFSDKVNKVEQFVQWGAAVAQFAADSSQMKPEDRATVQTWVKSMELLWNKSAPFGDWLKDKKTTALFAALEESEASAGLAAAEAEAIATAGAVLATAGALLYVGIAALDAGVKVVNVYLNRYDEIMKRIEEEAGSRPRDPEPTQPEDWESEDDRLKRRDDDVRRVMSERRANAEWAEDMARAQAVQLAKEKFEETMFVHIYQQNRTHIVAQVEEAIAHVSQSDQREDKSDQLPLPLVWQRAFSEEAGAADAAWRVKRRVSDDEAKLEFHELLQERCPYVKVLHDYELRKYVESAVPPLDASKPGQAPAH